MFLLMYLLIGISHFTNTFPYAHFPKPPSIKSEKVFSEVFEKVKQEYYSFHHSGGKVAKMQFILRAEFHFTPSPTAQGRAASSILLLRTHKDSCNPLVNRKAQPEEFSSAGRRESPAMLHITSYE